MMILAALPDGAIPLAVGTALALGGLSLVLSPLLGESEKSDASLARDARKRAAKAALDHAEIPADSAVVALREIEFDRETGKLSDSDYTDLKTRYTQLALDELRATASKSDAERASAIDGTGDLSERKRSVSDASADPVEAAIQRARDAQRACEVCGPRPEPDATYCSSCGRYLAGCCGECGTPVDLVGSHFCTNCGESLVVA